MERTLHLQNRLADLAVVEAGLAALTGPQGLSVEIAAEARLVLEEAFTNIVKYAHPDGRDDHPVTIRLVVQPGWLDLELIDGGAAFDPLAQSADELAKPFAERADGLMGIPLIRALMDDCRYLRIGSRNHLQLRKRLGRPM
jgi:anti-sigma regulatory factor (Ser/Thr protein kinase)